MFIIAASSITLFGCVKNSLGATIDGKKFKLEVAKTVDEKAQGLSGRKKLNKSSGMIFLYDKPQILSFWMKDTLIPLQIIFVDGCKIVDIQEMTVENDPRNPQKTYFSKQPADKAIELNTGSISDGVIGKTINELCR